ncbi:MAG: NAD-dependent epimerase/dehydratase family protein [Bacillota bacterium]
MDVLVLGGTQLTGRHLVPELLNRGYRVTLLTRGNRRPDFLPRVEHVLADRFVDGLQAVTGRQFDAVVDNIACEPTHVQAGVPRRWPRG